MTDPKNIPLAEARPGDMVFLKPRRVTGVMTGMIDAGHIRYHPNEIDHIERPARALKVGDRVRFPSRGTEGTVEALHKVVAWVQWDQNATPVTEHLTDLEPAE